MLTAERGRRDPPAPSGSKGKLVVGYSWCSLRSRVVGGLVYIKRHEDRHCPSADPETGDRPDGARSRWTLPARQGEEADRGPAFYIDQDGSVERDVPEVLRGDESSACPEVSRRSSRRPGLNITIADAIAFAKWADKRLPTAVEWEKAARGTEGKIWPWGDVNEAKLANVADNPNFREHKLMPVNSMAESASPYGLLHMAGNALEYVADDITPSTDAVEHFSNILNPPPALNEPWYSVKGGSFAAPDEPLFLGSGPRASSISARGYRFPLRERSCKVTRLRGTKSILAYRSY